MNNKIMLLAISMAITAAQIDSASAEGWKDALNAVKQQAQGQSLSSTAQPLQTAPQVVNSAQEIKSGSLTLTDMLMKQVGVTQAQAEGGAGALFQVAKTKMQPDSFTQLAQSVPGMESMMGAAPDVSQSSGIGGLSSLAGLAGGNTSSLLAVASSFQQQGMSPAMIQQFVPVVIDYVKSNSGGALANTLSSALLGQ